MNENYKVSVILLAAGLSSRMRAGHKLLLPFKRHTIIEETMTQLEKIKALEWIIVMGHLEERLTPLVSGFSHFKKASNLNYKDGLTSSIQEGVKHSSSASEGFMLCLSDLPFITDREYQNLLDVFSNQDSSKPCIVRAIFQENHGHPVIFSRHFKEDILKHQNPKGCRGIIQKNLHHLIEVNMNSETFLRDIDTDEDYQRFISTADTSK